MYKDIVIFFFKRPCWFLSLPDWSYGGAAYSFLSGASGGLIAALPGGNVARLGYGALGAYRLAAMGRL